MNQAVDQLTQQLNELEAKIAEAKALAADPDMAELVAEEIKSLEAQKTALSESIASLSTDFVTQKSAASDLYDLDQNNALLELKPGAGGSEAKIWADDLLRMYTRFAESNHIKIEVLDDDVVKAKGRGAYGLFKYESGVHRVQRVPETESAGRIHTSTAAVAVLPEIAPTQVTVREEDLDWKFTRAGGHGGQNVNKVNTAVLLTHVPSGIVVSCRQERYQQQNRIIALEILRSKLWEIEEEKRLSSLTTKRREAIGRNMRAEKIRTYNYPENRVTDHRIGKTWKELDIIMEGKLDKVIAALKEDELAPESQPTAA